MKMWETYAGRDNNMLIRISQKYKCPYANQCDCNETFESQEAASNHSFGHDVTPLHIRDGQFLCPYTEDFGRKGCKATFGTIGEINGHISSVHKEKGIPIPCPISSDCEITGYRTEGLRLHCDVHHRKKHTYPCPYEDCDKSNPLHSSLYDHIQTKHSGKKFVCHLCGKELKSRTGLRDHINSPAHNDKTYPCPHKDDPVIQCPEEFRSAFLAKTHARNEHEGHKDDEKKIHTCPGAGDPYNCTEKFSDKSNARSHYRDVHLKVTQKCPHCGIDVKNLTKHLKYHEKEFLCPDSACTKRFDTSEEALLHVTDPSHQPNVSMFDCPFSSCHLAVKGRGLLKHALVNHWNMHIRKGHVSHEEKLVLIPFKRRPFRTMELFEDIYKSGKFIDHTCNTDSGDSNSPEDDQEDQHEEDQEIENRSIFSLSSGDGTKLTQQRRSFVLAQNTQWWEANEDKAVSLATRGQNCPGASSVKDGLVLERCQFFTIIDLDTARLKQRKGKTILEGRCVECQASLREKQLLSRFTNSSLDGLKDVDVNSLRERFTNYTQTKWQVPADYQTVMDIAEEIKAGNRPGTNLVVLDVEFSPVSDQVWEIAVVEFVSGKVVINALVDHGDDIRHTFSSYKTPKLLEEVSKSVHRKVYSQEGRLKKVNVDKIAEELRQGGISPNIVVLVWQWGPRDLQLSQRLLKAGGHDDIWPETCLPLIKQFRLNTPMAKGDKKHFSLKLEILFAVVYPRSGLVGMNHRAVIDCRQTRLLCQAFEDLSLPVDRRKMNWEMEMKPKLTQLTIQDSFQHLQVTNKRTAPNEHHGSSREKRQKGNRD